MSDDSVTPRYVTLSIHREMLEQAQADRALMTSVFRHIAEDVAKANSPDPLVREAHRGEVQRAERERAAKRKAALEVARARHDAALIGASIRETAVLKLHAPQEGVECGVCMDGGWDDWYGVAWPCETWLAAAGQVEVGP